MEEHQAVLELAEKVERLSLLVDGPNVGLVDVERLFGVDQAFGRLAEQQIAFAARDEGVLIARIEFEGLR